MVKKDWVMDIIEKVLMDNGVQKYFWGGSRRFGWNHSPNPDYDIFVLIGPKTDLKEISMLLKLKSVPVYTAYATSGIHLETSIFGNDIDIIVFQQEELFSMLQAEHRILENFLLEHQEIKTIFSNLPISGVLKYRAVLESLSMIGDVWTAPIQI